MNVEFVNLGENRMVLEFTVDTNEVTVFMNDLIYKSYSEKERKDIKKMITSLIIKLMDIRCDLIAAENS